MSTNDSGVLPLPQWFKDEMAAQEAAEKHAYWLECFERRVGRMWPRDVGADFDERYEEKLEMIRKRDDAPEGIIDVANQVKKIADDETLPDCIRSRALAAIDYLVNGLGAIPDCIPGGFEDDMFILTHTLETLSEWIPSWRKER